MYDRHRSRSRSRERRPVASSDLKSIGSDLASNERAQREGYLQFRRQTDVSNIALGSLRDDEVRVEESSFSLNSQRISSMKATGAPKRALINKEMSKEMEIRQSSPSVVARLMGLDTLPCLISKQPKEVRSSFHKTSSAGLQQYVSYVDSSLGIATDGREEFKDVYEVMETPKTEKHNYPLAWKETLNSKSYEIDMAFIRKKFMDAKHLSTDETFHSREFDDALEVLGSNKDLFQEFLQEPNSLFKKHLQDLNGGPTSSHSNRITILKPSKGAKHETSELHYKSERKAERHSHMETCDISSSNRHTAGLVGHNLKEHSCSLPYKLSESLSTGKHKACLQPAQIVVLKPSLEKAREAAGTVSFSRSPDNYQFGFQRHKEIQKSSALNFYAEGGDRRKLCGYEEDMGRRTKGLRETAREITRQMKISGSNSNKKLSASKKYGYIRDERSYGVSGISDLNSKVFQQTTDDLNGCSDILGSSSYYSTESSVSREARKRLSERWKMTHHFQEGPVGRGSSTLGEMLASCDREAPTATQCTSIVQNVANEKVHWPLGISSKDGWKDGWSRNLPRSKSLPALPLVYKNCKSSIRNSTGGKDDSYFVRDFHNKNSNHSVDRKFRRRRSSSLGNFKCHHSNAQLYYGREDNKLFEREIHVNSEELTKNIHDRYHCEEVRMIPEILNDSVAGMGHTDNKFSGHRGNGAKFPSKNNDKQVRQSTALSVLARNGEISGAYQDIEIQETSNDSPQVNMFPALSDISETISPVSSKEADQPSPVSVLEPPYEDEKSIPECFEKIGTDLQDLRAQLKLLKLESTFTDSEDLEVLISSDEDTGGECNSFLKLEEIIEAFRDEEDRDFSYLLDLLIDSGVQGATCNVPFDACHSPDYPVGLDVFERLEKKYSPLLSWSRSERKLLFDLINSILADSAVPSFNSCPWVSSRSTRPILTREGLVEEVWQMVCRRRKELNGNTEDKLLELRWLDLGVEVDTVGRELERMLNEELVEELLFELMSR